MNKNVIIAVVAFCILLVGVFAFFATKANQPAFSNLDDFSKCLTEKGVTMYGAVWCPHCQRQKKLFGDSFQYINYIECPDNPQACTDAGIQNYPTWKFKDGTKIEGEISLQKLSEITACSLPSPR